MCEQGEGLLKEGKPAEALAIFGEVIRFLPTSLRASQGADRARRLLREMGPSVAPGVPVAPLATLAPKAHGKTACVQINPSHEALFENADVAELLLAEGLAVQGPASAPLLLHSAIDPPEWTLPLTSRWDAPQMAVG